jgi:hypothetical protein
MKYRVRKYRDFKRKDIFETYEPKKRVEFSRTDTLPLLVRVGNRFMCLGGLIGFWASSILIGIKGIFGFKKKVDSFSLNNRVVEIRIKKHD